MHQNAAIIVHGYTVKALNLFENGLGPLNQDWHYLVWGDVEKQLLGRASKGVLLALRQDSTRLLFGTGASWISESGETINRADYDSLPTYLQADFISEAEFTLRFVLDHFDELLEFKEIADEIHGFIGGLPGAKSFIRHIACTEEVSSNTTEEIQNALQVFCRDSAIRDICMVSNAAHLSRIVWPATQVLKLFKDYFSSIFTTSCDTDFARAGEAPCIFEPHSGPTPRPAKHPSDVFKSYWQVPDEKRIELLYEFEQLLQKYTS